MRKYIVKRILTGLLTIFVLITITFFLTKMMPGSPFQSNEASGIVLEAMEEEYGLHQPVYVQYVQYIKNLLHGDLGVSYKKPGVTVSEVIGRALPATAAIGGLALVCSLLLGVTLGIWLAATKRKAVRCVLSAATSLSTSIPNFVVAILLLLTFGVWLEWLPIAGLTDYSNYVLPVIALSVYPTAMITKYMSHAFAEISSQEYITMARAKRLPKSRIIRTHILKNAMLPVLNGTGTMFAFLLTGSFAVESIFTIPGLGREFVNSIANRDYTMIMGLVIFMGTVVILVHLIIDLICAALDPRIRRSLSSSHMHG